MVAGITGYSRAGVGNRTHARPQGSTNQSVNNSYSIKKIDMSDIIRICSEIWDSVRDILCYGLSEKSRAGSSIGSSLAPDQWRSDNDDDTRNSISGPVDYSDINTNSISGPVNYSAINDPHSYLAGNYLANDPDSDEVPPTTESFIYSPEGHA